MPSRLLLLVLTLSTAARAQYARDPYDSTRGPSTASGRDGRGQARSSDASVGTELFDGEDHSQSRAVDLRTTEDLSNSTEGGDADRRRSSNLRTRFPHPGEPWPKESPPGEFEKFVWEALGSRLPRFGDALVIDAEHTFAPGFDAVAPPDYVLMPGDEVLVRINGSIEADKRLEVDRSGQIHLPKIGAVKLSGIRHDQIQSHVDRQIAKRFRGFELSVGLGQLHGIRVYVTGFANNPGAYTLGSLSTLVNAVMAAGGPAASGSFRAIELRRGGKAVASFDLYDLLIRGDKTHDAVLQTEDVIYVGPVGPQVAVYGSVNAPAIFEATPDETLETLLQFAGGLNSVAESGRVAIERLSDRGTVIVHEAPLSAAGQTVLRRGDLYRIFSLTNLQLPLERRAKLVRIEGEVQKPGEYVLPPGGTLSQLVAKAGGVTPRGYVFGAELSREALRQLQQASYDRAIQAFETTVLTSALTTRVPADEAVQRGVQTDHLKQLVDRMQRLRPSGRMVLAMKPNATALPDLPLEHGDRLYIPPRPTTVQVFGSVFNAGSFAYKEGDLGKYLKQAGGMRDGADGRSVFVLRADGTVTSNRQKGWFTDVRGDRALPGDTLFVPEKMNKTTFLQVSKDFGTILYQYGLGAAALKVLLSN